MKPRPIEPNDAGNVSGIFLQRIDDADLIPLFVNADYDDDIRITRSIVIFLIDGNLQSHPQNAVIH